MSHPEPRIQCSNPQCTSLNEISAHFCERCGTPIIRRYLWSDQKAIPPKEKNTLINGRYLALSEQIFLDTQPNIPPHTPEEVPENIVVYLQLFPCYPHIPQAYGLLDGTDSWLFDYGTVPTDDLGNLAYPQQLIPKIEELWPRASSLQQLNWLWQITKLWKPLSSKNVASTLLQPELIRLNGQVVQLIHLQPDGEQRPSLRELGSLWSKWSERAQPNIQDIIEQIAARLETGIIEQSSQIIAALDRAILSCREAYQYCYRISAFSDPGPSRTNNEDAAYPNAPESHQTPILDNALAIVCDGVGGHDGGEIASRETIKFLRKKISQLEVEKNNSGKILGKLAKYINGANDIICKRNDDEQREERQRMGTTLVMALSCAQEMYLSHVGDSRIYWITANSCHQVTIDDDLASREVRLGYALYRDSLQYPSAGALIQALGMRDSQALHPNLQRYILDDDCIFLLCTDGLSDFDRVEQQWRENVLPVLEGKQELSAAVKDLIALANAKNGHDNVTVALVHCQVKPIADVAQVPVKWSDIEPILAETTLWSDTSLADSMWTEASSEETDLAETEISAEQIGEGIGSKSQPKWLQLMLSLLVASSIFGLAIWILAVKAPNDDKSPINDLEAVEQQE